MASSAAFRHDIQTITIPADVLPLGFCLTKVTLVLNYNNCSRRHAESAQYACVGVSCCWPCTGLAITLKTPEKWSLYLRSEPTAPKTMSCPGTWDLLDYLRYFPLPNQDFRAVAFCVCSAVYIQHMQNRVAMVFFLHQTACFCKPYTAASFI